MKTPTHEKLEETMEADPKYDKDNNICRVEVDYAPDIRFKGDFVAGLDTNYNNAHSDNSGKIRKWNDWSIYKTESGKFVCKAIEYTRRCVQKEKFKGAVCENEKEVIEFFGHSRQAKILYEKAGIDDVIEVK